ncbi:MAG TPA: hypothetical protein IGR64_05925 [Leptolyngbyaceae cyanobacterium M65_K2018_010]|nr:hypothetical protein [Leptolyngbyaceae cyanobacterium M65_K2018_010]
MVTIDSSPFLSMMRRDKETRFTFPTFSFSLSPFNSLFPSNSPIEPIIWASSPPQVDQPLHATGGHKRVTQNFFDLLATAIDPARPMNQTDHH